MCGLFGHPRFTTLWLRETSPRHITTVRTLHGCTIGIEYATPHDLYTTAVCITPHICRLQVPGQRDSPMAGSSALGVLVLAMAGETTALDCTFEPAGPCSNGGAARGLLESHMTYLSVYLPILMCITTHNILAPIFMSKGTLWHRPRKHAKH